MSNAGIRSDARDFQRVGPYTQVCKICGQRLSSNALARAGHVKGKRHLAALAKLEGK